MLSIEKREDKALKNLRDVAQPTDSYEARWKAWRGYAHDAKHTAGRLAARGFGSKDDFRRRLDAAKLDFSNDEDEA